MKVKELLDSPEKWTQGKLARDNKNICVPFKDPYAVCWCLVGALYKCYPTIDTQGDIYNRIKEHLDIPTCAGVWVWNDHSERTFEDIRKLVEELDI